MSPMKLATPISTKEGPLKSPRRTIKTKDIIDLKTWRFFEKDIKIDNRYESLSEEEAETEGTANNGNMQDGQ